MGSKIQRINIYDDMRFDEETLRQHGAFIVDEKYKCSFRIISCDSAVLSFDEEVQVEELIDEFRFYTGHISNFYDEKMNLIKSFLPVDVFEIEIKDIQPSQFFADEDKVRAVGSFIACEEDVCIPLAKIENRFISEDGHTRLYYAVANGFKKVRAFICEKPGDYTWEFSEEARKRGVYNPYDIKLISHEEYERKWHKFCDNFFSEKSNK